MNEKHTIILKDATGSERAPSADELRALGLTSTNADAGLIGNTEIRFLVHNSFPKFTPSPISCFDKPKIHVRTFRYEGEQRIHREIIYREVVD